MRLLLVAAALATLSGAAFAEGRYVNARFGYAVCVPGGLTGQGESENGDGQRFVADDGAELIVYGAHNALGETLEDRRASALERLGPASYRAGGRDWFVVSGRTGDRVYYVRTTLRRGVFASFELTYPSAAAARWNAAAADLLRCFRAR